MLWNLHMNRYFQYVYILEHLFNTGQGIVLERSPFSDWAYIDAAYNHQGKAEVKCSNEDLLNIVGEGFRRRRMSQTVRQGRGGSLRLRGPVAG